MNNETGRDPQQQKQQQGKHLPTESGNTSDTKTNPLPGNPSHNNPQDISKKNPSQDSGDSQHKGQQKPEDEKRRAS
jgi:hypothetical protein